MKKIILRPFAAEIKWGRVLLWIALILGFGLVMSEPAFAQGGGDAFSTFQDHVTTQTGKAVGVARTVLLVAAVLSLICAFAPMLWGQIKTKWIITSLLACVLFGLSALAVSAFAGESVGGQQQMTGQQYQ